jgi:DNA adenine methylase
LRARDTAALLPDADSAIARPFVKWAGGKAQLLPELRKHVPARFGRYIEPFVGGGALFFELRAQGRLKNDVLLSDANARLIATYRALRDDAESVIVGLREYSELYMKAARADARRRKDDHKAVRAFYFYARKERQRAGLLHADELTAAWVIFMLKAGFNGIWRENKKGEYNVPPGRSKTPPTICDEENLRACSLALAGVDLKTGDFEIASKAAKRGDFWYADPPYVPASATSDFTAYTRDPFGPAAQERLRDLALRLKKRGVSVLLSNSDTPFVRKLYRQGFELRRVRARRSVNSVSDKRGHVRELLIW